MGVSPLVGSSCSTTSHSAPASSEAFRIEGISCIPCPKAVSYTHLEGAPDMNYILTGVPVMDDDSLIMINAGVKLCINSKTEHSAEAEKFIEFMTGKESLDKYVQSQNSFSPLKDGSSTSNAVVDPVAEYLTSGRMISWVDPSFKSPVEPWTIARSYASNIAAGADIDTTVKDMDTDLTNKIKLK